MSTGVDDDERECRICLDSDLKTLEDRWLSPCNCSGSMKWVHKSCLKRWIDSVVHPNQRDRCSTCGFAYKKRLRLKRLNELLVIPSHAELVHFSHCFFQMLPSLMLAMIDALMVVFLALILKLCLAEGFASVLYETLNSLLDEPQVVWNVIAWIASFKYRPRRELYRQLAEWTLFKPDFDDDA